MAKLTDNMLKFRRGLFKDLPAARVPGTIYITTDEKGMYVDLSSSERIRVGDLIQVSSFANKGEGPFFPSVLYYFEAENALAKYTADGKWIQINNTSDLQDNLDKLQTKYTTLATEVHGTDGNGGMKAEITALKATTSTATQDITELKGKIESLEITGGQANVIEKITAGETNIEIDATSKTAKLGHLAAPGAKVIEEDLSDTLKTRIETLEATDKTHAAAIANKADSSTVTKLETTLNKKVTDLTADVKSKHEEQAILIQSNADAIAGLTDKVGAGLSGGKTLTEQVNANTAALETQATTIGQLATKQQLENAKSQLNTSINDLNTTLTGKINTNSGLIKDNAEAIESVSNIVGNGANLNNKTLTQHVLDNAASIQSQATEIQGVKTDIADNYVKKTYLNAEKVKLNAAIKEAKDAADAAQDTADTAVTDAATAQATAEAAQTAAEAAQAKADSNATKITEVSGRVETIEDKLNSVTNVMDFIGVSTTDPTKGTVTIDGTVIPPNKGDVVIYGNKEFVYDGSAWKEYGDVGAQETAITALQGKVTTLEGEMDTAQADIENLGTRAGNLETRVAAAESQLVWYDFSPSTDNT